MCYVWCRRGVELMFFFFFQAEDGIRDYKVTGVQTCALPISRSPRPGAARPGRGDRAARGRLRSPPGPRSAGGGGGDAAGTRVDPGRAVVGAVAVRVRRRASGHRARGGGTGVVRPHGRGGRRRYDGRGRAAPRTRRRHLGGRGRGRGREDRRRRGQGRGREQGGPRGLGRRRGQGRRGQGRRGHGRRGHGRRRGQGRRRGVSGLVDGYDLVIFDLDGVVYLGAEPVPGAVEAVNRLRERGTALVYATNNAARRPDEVAAALTGLGIPATADEVLTSPHAAAALLAGKLKPGAPVLIVGTGALAAEVAGVGLTPVSSADDKPVAVVQGYGPNVGWPELAEACVAVRGGALWVATNGDRTLPAGRGPLPGSGCPGDAR